ncbi:MAG: T9SS type A sorting domain-containing protein [Flavipsychrobacter sp.]|nr:T9SS type A sorting domain-containing protein [Flavipsychrobacter sp.]
MNSRKIFFCTLLVVLCAQAYAQHPHNAIFSIKNVGGNNDDVVSSADAIPTADSGFILSIYTTSNSNTINHSCVVDTANGEYLFQKYDPSGTVVQWEKCFTYGNGFAIEYLFPVVTGWIETGHDVNSQWGPIIRKENTNGTIAWTKSYGGLGVIDKDWKKSADGGYAVLMESYYVSGDVAVAYGNSGDMFVLKVDSNGNKQWATTIGGSGEDMPEKLVAAPDNGFFVIGATESDDYDCTGPYTTTYRNGYVARLDKNGNIKWHLDLGGNVGALALNGCNDGKGGVVIAAVTESTAGISHPKANPGGGVYWIIDVDSNGHITWDNCFGDTVSAYPYSICRGVDGNFYVLGGVIGSGEDVDHDYGSESAWLVKVNKTNGSLMSECVIGSPQTAQGYMTTSLKDGNIIVAGFYEGTSNGPNGNLPPTSAGNRFTDIFLAILSPWSEAVPVVKEPGSEITIYPNPAAGSFHVKISSTLAVLPEGTVTITDMLGKILLRQNFGTKAELNINSANWAAGCYLVVYENGTGERETHKLVIQ